MYIYMYVISLYIYRISQITIFSVISNHSILKNLYHYVSMYWCMTWYYIIYNIYIYQYCVTVLIYTYHYKSHVLWITISLYYYIPLYITVLMSYMTWTYRVTSLAPRGAGLSSFAPSMRKTTASVAAMVDVGGPAGHLGRSNGWRNLGKPWELRKNYGKKPCEIGKKRRDFGNAEEL